MWYILLHYAHIIDLTLQASVWSELVYTVKDDLQKMLYNAFWENAQRLVLAPMFIYHGIVEMVKELCFEKRYYGCYNIRLRIPYARFHQANIKRDYLKISCPKFSAISVH